MRIAGLDASLAAAREQMEALAILKGDSAPFNGKVTIQGDRKLEFRLLQKVMATCSAQGFDQLSLAVIRDS